MHSLNVKYSLLASASPGSLHFQMSLPSLLQGVTTEATTITQHMVYVDLKNT